MIGRKERFDPAKLNGWGEWASKALGKDVDWSEAVLHVYSTSNEETTSEALQVSLIDYCLTKGSWSYNRMAGRLYTALLYKQIYNKDAPDSLYDVHHKLVEVGLMSSDFFEAYSKEDYIELEKIINHNKNLSYAHYQIKQIMKKYSLMNRVTNTFYETPQHVYMRVAMRMCQNKGTGKVRIERIKRHYKAYSSGVVNIPTPYFTNAGTKNSGFLSCNVFRTKDTIGSLTAGDHIAYMMTVNSAGQGSKIYTRTIGSPVKGGSIVHSGKINYYRTQVAMINANLQNGRGGAETQYYDCFDPEWEVIQKFKNQMTPVARQVRGLDYSMCFNTFFLNRAAQNEQIALLNYAEFPDLYEAMADKDPSVFENLYTDYLNKGLFKSFVNARDVLVGALKEGLETGRHYLCNLTEMNRHSPFIDKIYQSNLCGEIKLSTKAYNDISELYWPKYLEEKDLDPSVRQWLESKIEETSGEVATCALAAIAVGKVKSEEEYKEAAWVALDMIHTAIKESDYALPHIGYTSRSRMSAGVGMIDLAHAMAQRKLSYNSQEGRNYIHQISETHYWHLLNASLELSKEFGNAPWIHKTKWVGEKPWLPIDTYNKNTDSLITVGLQYDWEELRQRIKENGGHAFSVLAADMPSESSSISAGTTNSLYPIRDLSLRKSNETNTVDFVVPDSDKLGKYYESAWDLPLKSIINSYALKQKWTDQTISADVWYKVNGSNRISSTELLDDFFYAQYMGVPNRYYTNSNTSKGIEYGTVEQVTMETEEPDCAGCKL